MHSPPCMVGEGAGLFRGTDRWLSLNPVVFDSQIVGVGVARVLLLCDKLGIKKQ